MEIDTPQTEKKENFQADFIGVGAPRCATTWISACLQEHPQICVSQPKETAFFSDYFYKKGAVFYSSFFNHCLPGQTKGEFCPTYIFKEDIAERIREHNPDAKLIFCFRNPIERAYSQYLFNVNRGNRGIIFNSFEEALKEEENVYIKGSMYYHYLEKYLRIFPKENVLILIYEDIEKDPIIFAQRIFRFLGVDDTFVPAIIEERMNKVKEMKVRSRMVAKAMWQLENFLRQRKKNFLIKLFYNSLKFSSPAIFIRRKVQQSNLIEGDNASAEKRAPIDAKTRECLREIFRSDVEKLEKFLGRELIF